jgi:hypothetical protein
MTRNLRKYLSKNTSFLQINVNYSHFVALHLFSWWKHNNFVVLGVYHIYILLHLTLSVRQHLEEHKKMWVVKIKPYKCASELLYTGIFSSNLKRFLHSSFENFSFSCNNCKRFVEEWNYNIRVCYSESSYFYIIRHNIYRCSCYQNRTAEGHDFLYWSMLITNILEFVTLLFFPMSIIYYIQPCFITYMSCVNAWLNVLV